MTLYADKWQRYIQADIDNVSTVVDVINPDLAEISMPETFWCHLEYFQMPRSHSWGPTYYD